MQDIFSRTAQLIGNEAVQRLNASTVAGFGLGGVGSFVVEGLARSGIGHLVLIDNDKVNETNINRQLIALTDTIGEYKTDVAKKRVLSINPQAKVEIITDFYLPDKAEQFFISDYDYIVDAIDTVTAKIDIAVQAETRGIPMISCMGTGNKLDPTRFEVTDIKKTSICPLARVMRRELKARGIDSLKVVYSKEEPRKSRISEDGRNLPGSVSFVPPVAGLIIAGEVVKDLIGEIK